MGLVSALSDLPQGKRVIIRDQDSRGRITSQRRVVMSSPIFCEKCEMSAPRPIAKLHRCPLCAAVCCTDAAEVMRHAAKAGRQMNIRPMGEMVIDRRPLAEAPPKRQREFSPNCWACDRNRFLGHTHDPISDGPIIPGVTR